MNIFLADDHPLYRMALAGLLKQLDEHVDITDCCNFNELQVALSEADILPDLILLDLCMPGMVYEEAIQDLKQKYPDINLVIISGLEDTMDMSKVLNLGAEGFIPKSSSREVLLSAIRLVLSGGKYIPAQIFNGSDAQPEKTSFPTRRKPTATIGGSKGPESLTRRQRHVLDLMSEGHSNRDIAGALNLAESTVKVHITAIFRILGVSNRTQAVLQAKEFA